MLWIIRCGRGRGGLVSPRSTVPGYPVLRPASFARAYSRSSLFSSDSINYSHGNQTLIGLPPTAVSNTLNGQHTIGPASASSSLLAPTTATHTPRSAEPVRSRLNLNQNHAQSLKYPYKLVDSPDLLSAAVDALRKSRVFALDVEAFCTEAPHTHLGQISLIQACGDANPVVYLIDVLTLSPERVSAALGPVLANEQIRKLFFDCRRDVEALSVQMGLVPANALDVQLQYTALQWRERGVKRRSSISYVLQGAAGITRQESYTAVHTAMTAGRRPVWDERPLRPALLEYAADDVRHLPLLAAVLESQSVGVVSTEAVQRLTSRYVAHYAVGHWVTTEPDPHPAEVNESWLESVIGPGGSCAFCQSKGHTERECFKKGNGTVQCSFCKEFGHTAPSCYRKHPQRLKCDLCGEVGHPASSCFKTNPCVHCGGFHSSASCHRSFQRGPMLAQEAVKRAVYEK